MEQQKAPRPYSAINAANLEKILLTINDDPVALDGCIDIVCGRALATLASLRDDAMRFYLPDVESIPEEDEAQVVQTKYGKNMGIFAETPLTVVIERAFVAEKGECLISDECDAEVFHAAYVERYEYFLTQMNQAHSDFEAAIELLQEEKSAGAYDGLVKSYTVFVRAVDEELSMLESLYQMEPQLLAEMDAIGAPISSIRWMTIDPGEADAVD